MNSKTEYKSEYNNNNNDKKQTEYKSTHETRTGHAPCVGPKPGNRNGENRKPKTTTVEWFDFHSHVLSQLSAPSLEENREVAAFK